MERDPNNTITRRKNRKDGILYRKERFISLKFDLMQFKEWQSFDPRENDPAAEAITENQ